MSILNNLNLKRKVFKFLLIIILLLIFIYLVSILIKEVDILNTIFINWKIYLSKILLILNYQFLSFWNIQLSLSSLIAFSLIISIWLFIWKVYKLFIYSLKRKKNNISHWTATILANIWYYIILSIVFMSSVRVIGIDLSSLTVILWALSVGIWFGLQTIVSNFISGIILMFEKSIQTGDYIEIWEDLRWTVIDINMRSTTIKTNNNIDIIVPNKSFIENNIINWTHNDNTVRLLIPFGVAYWTTFEEVEEIILNDLKKSKLDYLREPKYEPSIFMTWMWNSSVDFKLSVRVKWDETNTPLIAKWKFLRLIYKSLNENKITIPFPQTDLHIKDSVPLEIKMITKK